MDKLKYLKNYKCSDIARITKYNKYTDNNEYVRIFVYYLNMTDGIDEKFYKSKNELMNDYFNNCSDLNMEEKMKIKRISKKKIKNTNELQETDKEFNNIIKEPNKRIKKRFKKVKNNEKEIQEKEQELNDDLKEINEDINNNVDKEIIKNKKRELVNKKRTITRRKKVIKQELKKIKNEEDNLENIKKIVNNKNNCNYGINTEQEARFNFEKDFMLNVLKNSYYKLHVKKFYYDENNYFNICGLVDGIIINDNKKYILEIKNRKNRIFNSIPIYEHIQLLIYSKLLDINNIVFVQKYKDKSKTEFINDFNDDELFNTIIKRLVDYTLLIFKLRENNEFRYSIFNNGNPYDNLSNYLTWLKPYF